MRLGGIVGLAILVSLSGCTLQTSATAPAMVSVSVSPEFICAGEAVQVSWDAGEQVDSPECRGDVVGHGPLSGSTAVCTFVDRTSSPSIAAWDGTHDLRSVGTIGAAVDGTTTFTVRATVESYRGSGRAVDLTASATAQVIEVSATPLPFTFEGACRGGAPVWVPVMLKDRLSGCVEVIGVCNSSTHSIHIEDAENPARHTTLAPAGRPEACTDMFNGRGTNLAGRDLDFVPRPDMCGATLTSGGPPDFSILVRVQCNRNLDSCSL